jgi:hypothetical protein
MSFLSIHCRQDYMKFALHQTTCRSNTSVLPRAISCVQRGCNEDQTPHARMPPDAWRKCPEGQAVGHPVTNMNYILSRLHLTTNRGKPGTQP